MKKILLNLLPVFLVFGLVSCEKGLDGESPFINPGDNPTFPGNENWAWADSYPGPVNSQIETLPDTAITIKGQYKPLPYSPATPILQSTGLYIGIDSPVYIDVPAGVVGLKYQIGLARKLAADQGQRRYSDVVKKGALEPGRKNQISSNFGGYLYLYYEPEDVASAQAEATVHVSNAYQSFDYFKGSDPETQRYYVRIMKERNDKLRDTSIPDDELVFLNWTELRSPKIILTFGLKEMYYLINPDRLLEQYEKLVDAFLEFGGYGKAEDYELPLFRIYADIQLPNPKQKVVSNSNGTHNYDQDARKIGGYPMGVLKSGSMRGTDKVDENRYMNEKGELEFGYTTRENVGFAGIQYGFGITVLGEWATAAWMKYPLLRLANHYYCQYLSNFGDFWGSKYYADTPMTFQNILKVNRMNTPYGDNHANKYMWYASYYANTGDKDNGDVRGTPNQTRADYNSFLETRRMTPIMQLVQRYGWGIIKYINQRCLEIGFVNEYEQDAHDFFVMAACEYADADLRPFFRWWQFPYTAYAAKFIRDQGFPPLTKEYPFSVSEKMYDFYFFDWPAAGETWFPNDRPTVNPDIRPEGVNPPRKAAVWPEKPYYSDVAKEKQWIAYGEVVQANPYYPDPDKGQKWVVEYKPEYQRKTTGNQTTYINEMLKAGFASSTYLWFYHAHSGSNPQSDQGMTTAAFVNNSWTEDKPGRLGFMKGGTNPNNSTNPNRGNDTTINWCILDIDFKRPVRLNAIKTRQHYDAAKEYTKDVVQSIWCYQYYVEPGYTQPADPSDPTSEPVYIETGYVVDEGYKYDPTGDPRRAQWYGFNDPRNNVPYPGRTMNMDDSAESATNSANINEIKLGNWGFHPKGPDGKAQAYFALLYPDRKPLIDHRKGNIPTILMNDQDWTTGITWLVRDQKNRSYVYYLEETIETRRIRLFLRPAINHRFSDHLSHEPYSDSWRISLPEISFGLVSTDIPAPGNIPAPHEFYKGMESGEYPYVTPRNYGGSNDGW